MNLYQARFSSFHLSRRVCVVSPLRYWTHLSDPASDISTAYVDRLQSYESPLTTVCSTLTTVLNNGGVVGHSGEQESTMERRPLLGDHLNSRPSPDMHNGSCKQGPCTEQQRDSLENHQQTPSYGAAAAAHQNDHAHGLNVTMRSTHTHTFGQGGEHVVGEIFQGHHRHEPRTIHETHHERVPRLPCLYDCQEFGELAHRHGGGGTAMCENGGGEDNRDMKVGNKRQVVGILVSSQHCTPSCFCKRWQHTDTTLARFSN